MNRLLNRPKREIQDVNEKAFQRAIFHNKITKTAPIRGKRKEAEIEWYDFESPIDKNREANGKARGEFNLDLIGKDKISKHFIICEVKFSCNKDDSPEDAAEEAFKYLKVIIDDACELDKIATHHIGGTRFSWQDVDPKDAEIWVVANSAYWTYWLGCERKGVPEIVGKDGFYKQVRCFSVDIPGDFFIKEKGERQVYEPAIPEDIIWTELIQ